MQGPGKAFTGVCEGSFRANVPTQCTYLRKHFDMETALYIWRQQVDTSSAANRYIGAITYLSPT